MSFYEVKVVDRSGAVLTTFDGGGTTRQAATVEQVTWILNEPGSATIRVPVFHPAAAVIGEGLPNEVQIFRDGTLIFWGVWLQADYDESTHSEVWTCPGLLWYFTRRYFGPISVNYLTNPNFATNLTGWTTVGAASSHSTAVRLRGPGTARLVSASSADNYLSQTFAITTGVIGVFLTAAGLYWVDPAVTLNEGAFEERGLYISSPDGIPDPSPNWEPVNLAAEVGVPQRAETSLHLAPSVSTTVTVRAYSPWGAIHWGGMSVTAPESVSSEPSGTDITEMIRRSVDYAQNGTGKSPLNITTSTPAAGVTEIVAYQFMDLANIFEVLASYPARGLADFKVVCTSTTRVFTTYAPRKGSHKAGFGVTVPGSAVLSMRSSRDGQQTSTKAIRRGQGEGSDRELGVAVDAAALGGLILEDVQDAPPETKVDDLDRLAATDLPRLKQVVRQLDVTVRASSWLGNVEEGDTVPVTINWGSVQDTQTRRVVQLTLSPKPDTLTAGLQVA